MSTLSRINRLIGPQRSLSLKIFFSVAAAVIVFDQLTKLIMVAYFKPVIQLDPLGMPELVYARHPIVLIPDLFQFMFRINTGAAFSSLTGKTVFLTVVSIVISLGVLAWACALKPGERGLRLSLGLIFGGAIGNLIDRLRLGYVIDFLDAHWREAYHYPTFNIADSAICVGIFLLFITSFTVTQPAGAPQPAPAKSTEVS